MAAPMACWRHAFIATLLGATLAGLALYAPAQDGDARATRAEIQRLEAEIGRMTREQRAREERRGELHGELRATEQRLAESARALAATRGEITAAQAQLATLGRRQQALQRAAHAQQAVLRGEVRRAYVSGREHPLRPLLSQHAPGELARTLAVYRYGLRARREAIEVYRATRAELAELAASLAAQRDTLQRRQQALARRQAQLRSERGERRALLARIEDEMGSEARALDNRRRDRQQLEALLKQIEAALAQLGPDAAVEPFSTARGTLAWPVDGDLTRRFGRPRNRGRMRWQGVRLQAPAGTTVAAVYHGRVVYADWLRGAGLLLVIDHGEGYMSLYAHNESLLREVGEWVSVGAAVATVGDSGGQSEAGLYFEIRKDGKPTDPQRWCRS